MGRVYWLAAGLMLCILLSNPLAAAEPLPGWGFRTGATMDPDQFHVGVHLDLGQIADRLRFQPNMEVGFGDNLTVIAFNPELLYLFKLNTRWTPYFGGGPGINVYDWHNDRPGTGESDTRVGFNFTGGIETRTSQNRRFFIELKAGTGDIPSAKMSFGMTFLK